MSDWIDVKDRLPDKKGMYLVTYLFNGEDLSVSTSCFDTYRQSWGRSDVLAWQPLPEPYRVPKGKWVAHSIYDDVLICSNCNRGSNLITINTDFCPNCGADMRGEE